MYILATNITMSILQVVMPSFTALTFSYLHDCIVFNSYTESFHNIAMSVKQIHAKLHGNLTSHSF